MVLARSVRLGKGSAQLPDLPAAGPHLGLGRQKIVRVVALRVLSLGKQLDLGEELLRAGPVRVLCLTDEFCAAAAEERRDGGKLRGGKLLVHIRKNGLEVFDGLLGIVEGEAPPLQTRSNKLAQDVRIILDEAVGCKDGRADR